MCKIILTVFILSFLNIYYSDCAKILAIYAVPSISHQLYFRTLTMELLKREHELTVVTTDPAFTNKTAPKNIREIDIHDKSYKLWESFLTMPIGKSNYEVIQIHTAYDAEANIFESLLKTEAVRRLLEDINETFDILLYDGSMISPLIFTHIYKIPAIAISSLGAIYGNYEAIGAVVNEAYFPSNFGCRTAKNQIERLQDIFKYYYNLFHIQWYIEKVQNDAVKKALGDHMPDIRELKKNINLMFINLYSAWDSHRPVPISLNYMGGLHSVLEKPLPEDIKSYLDSSSNGVIYMSLGTNVRPSRFEQKTLEIFTKVFSQFPYDVLWKYDYDTIPNKPKNVRLFKWLPQSVVLKHPKIKLFITQGGLQSTDEAITAGVPLIGIPMLADQWFNTEKYVRFSIGLKLDFGTLTEDLFRNAIETIVGNESYYSNIINHRNLMHDQPRKVIDHAVSWIEYVIKNGGSHLQAPAADISWAEYVELELLIIMMTIMVSALVGVYFSLKFVERFITSLATRNKVKNN